MKIKSILFLPFFLLYVTAKGQFKQPLTVGETHTLFSSFLQEERVVNIYLPEGYQESDSLQYQVIYLLDGGLKEDFLHVAGLIQFLTLYEQMPPSVLVGIQNVDRYRDFTTPSANPEDLKSLPTSGGAEAFMSFVQLELQPYIQQKIRTNGHDVLIGQSLGGLLATQFLLEAPETFDDYVIVSPSLWWDDQKLLMNASRQLSNPILKQVRVFVSLGKEHPVMHEVAEKLVDQLQDAEMKKVSFTPVWSEDHATILHRALYLAFEDLFSSKMNTSPTSD